MSCRLISFLFATMLFHPVFAQQPATDIPSTPSFGTTVVIPAGLHGSLYTIPESTTVLPDFEHDPIQRIGEVWTDTLEIPPRHWHSGFPGLTDRFEWFAIDYTGSFWIEQPGRYTFALISDDGSRLSIDETPIIDNDCLHSTDLRVAAVELEGGGHRIRVSYFQGPRDCLALILAIAGPDHQWKPFNTRDFKPPSNPEDWHFPAAGSITVVPTTPQEAALSLHDFVPPPEKPTNKSRRHDDSCAYAPPVRSCSR